MRWRPRVARWCHGARQHEQSRRSKQGSSWQEVAGESSVFRFFFFAKVNFSHFSLLVPSTLLHPLHRGEPFRHPPPTISRPLTRESPNVSRNHPLDGSVVACPKATLLQAGRRGMCFLRWSLTVPPRAAGGPCSAWPASVQPVALWCSCSRSCQCLMIRCMWGCNERSGNELLE